jgi:23S rRNA (cytidine1920-2'-O)/16S rRNA (cytidine1409-2'-O)-methyltransferase
MSSKQRLDTLLAERGLFPSRSRAAASVMAGEVRVGSDRTPAQKPGEMVAADVEVDVAEPPRFVSRGGIKLDNALTATGVAVSGRRALDVGSSTGGFTDCLLQHGAAHVTAVDVGYGDLHHRLRTDPRVHVLERTNARGLCPEMLRALPSRGDGALTGDDGGDGSRSFGCDVDPASPGDLPGLAVVDVSFISLAKVLPAVLGCLAPRYDALALVKPQFEVGRGRVGKGGVVRDGDDRRETLVAVGLAAHRLGAAVLGFCSSGLPGPKGNRESFVWLAEPGRPGVAGAGDPDEIQRMAREVEP